MLVRISAAFNKKIWRINLLISNVNASHTGFWSILLTSNISEKFLNCYFQTLPPFTLQDTDRYLGLLKQEFIRLEELVHQNEFKIANISYTMMQSWNQSYRQLIDSISENRDGFKALNESLQLKISGLEVSNVRKQLDLKVCWHIILFLPKVW